MIKTFEEFNSDILCEKYTPKKAKVIEKLDIYSKTGGGICKTWDDVLKLFSNPKYNVRCAYPYKKIEKHRAGGMYFGPIDSMPFEKIEVTYWHKYDDTLLDVLKNFDDIIEIYIYEGIIHVIYGKPKHEKSINLYILTKYGKSAQEKTDLSKTQYHIKIREDLLEWYNDPTNFEEGNKNNENDIVKDTALYDDFPHNDHKPNRTWEETIQILNASEYNVKCAVVELDKSNYGKYKFIYNNKEYRYKGRDIEVVDSVVKELENIQWHLDKMNQQTRKYKRLSINDGVIVYTVQFKRNSEYKFLIVPLNDEGQKITSFEKEDVDMLDPKYCMRIKNDIFDDVDTTISKLIEKIKVAESKEKIDKILNDIFKINSISQEQYSIIYGYSLCREIELGIWEPTGIKGEEIIKAFGERFGFDYFKKE